MKITALVENQSSCDLKAKHGLSLYIETQQHKILFDLGPDKTLLDNAEKRGIDLNGVDTVIISHGHLDHGGALGLFLKKNNHAKVYVQKSAFEPHYTKVLGIPFFCGLKPAFKNHPQVVLTDGDYHIDSYLSLFTVTDTSQFYSTVNDSLYEGRARDTFRHEQNLLIKEGTKTALIMGCGHAGVVNIMAKAASFHPTVCVGGYHLTNPNTKKTVPAPVMDGIAKVLCSYADTAFYTCHCTGQAAYRYLADRVPGLHYLSCGESIDL